MFASLGAYGHLYPMMPLALACAAAGHQTVIAIGPPFLGRLALPTVPGYPPDLQLDWAVQETNRRHPDLGRTDGTAVQMIPIRSVAYNESSADVPTQLKAPRTRPRVYLTLGTVSSGVEVLRRAISEMTPLDVDILVAVGPDGELAALGELPDNVHVERFVAQSAALPLVDLIVHHGGTGTVLGALEVGLRS